MSYGEKYKGGLLLTAASLAAAFALATNIAHAQGLEPDAEKTPG